MLNLWTQKSGYSFGTIEERTAVDLALPVTYTNSFNDSTNISFEVITGKLPPGLRIVEDRIVGAAFEVPRPTEFKFVIRATYNSEISDRTFSINVNGTDEPVWQTAAGPLPVGPNDAYYILDSSYIDFQLQIVDFDIAAGQQLKFFIPSGGGELPPGLVLTEAGRIVGWVQPTLAPPLTEGNGTYDNQRFDKVAYDYGLRPSNGYDSFIFDVTNFDYSVPSTTPKKLNRNFEFIVIVTDGENYAQRKFRIYVVGDDFFRSDNTVTRSGDGTFTADITYARAPVWVTPNYLGTFRANNYKTFVLDTYEGLYVGPISYNLEAINPDVYGLTTMIILPTMLASSIEPNKTYQIISLGTTNFNTISGITGVTYKVGNTFRSVTSGNGNGIVKEITRSDVLDQNVNRKNKNLLRLKKVQGTPTAGQKIRFSDHVTGASTQIKTITNVVKDTINDHWVLTVGDGGLPVFLSDNTLVYFGSLSELPPGMQFDASTAEVFGIIPYQLAITETYKFSIKATRYTEKAEAANSIRTFTADIIGEIDSTINWITPANLGSLGAEYISTLYLEAVTTVPDSVMLYRVTSGRLPPGITLNLNGELIGKVNQFPGEDKAGLTRFYDDPPEVGTRTFTTLDGDSTTIDKSYSFTVEARDILGYSAISRTFKLDIDTPNDRKFSNIFVKPFLKLNQRQAFKSFSSDPQVFDVTAIYRPDDPNFGIQTELRMLVYAGIETKSAAAVVGMAGRNHKIKRFRLGTTKKAIAYEPGTFNSLYEVVYLEVFDPLEKGKTYLPNVISTSYSQTPVTVDQNNQYRTGPFDINLADWNAPIPFHVTADRSDMFAGDPYNGARFPSSLALWRNRIKALGIKDRNFLPLWMRSIQEGAVQELGYVKAIPICFCKVGRADDILLNIKYSNFDFSQIDYTIDRYIIDAVSGYSNDKYIVFRNDRTTIS